jgi:methionyl-tRNA formyltransferase
VEYNNTALYIFRAKSDLTKTYPNPGEIINITKDSFFVACGEGQLEVKEVLPAGGKRMNAASFIRGRNLKIGDRLDLEEKKQRL